MKWFSLKGIMAEGKKVRWPKRNELVKDTFIAIIFIALFAVFFIASDVLIAFFLRIIGVGA